LAGLERLRRFLTVDDERDPIFEPKDSANTIEVVGATAVWPAPVLATTKTHKRGTEKKNVTENGDAAQTYVDTVALRDIHLYVRRGVYLS
jgi:hypothetical protein